MPSKIPIVRTDYGRNLSNERAAEAHQTANRWDKQRRSEALLAGLKEIFNGARNAGAPEQPAEQAQPVEAQEMPETEVMPENAEMMTPRNMDGAANDQRVRRLDELDGQNNIRSAIKPQNPMTMRPEGEVINSNRLSDAQVEEKVNETRNQADFGYPDDATDPLHPSNVFSPEMDRRVATARHQEGFDSDAMNEAEWRKPKASGNANGAPISPEIITSRNGAGNARRRKELKEFHGDYRKFEENFQNEETGVGPSGRAKPGGIEPEVVAEPDTPPVEPAAKPQVSKKVSDSLSFLSPEDQKFLLDAENSPEAQAYAESEANKGFDWKAEAEQQAQIALLTGNSEGQGDAKSRGNSEQADAADALSDKARVDKQEKDRIIVGGQEQGQEQGQIPTPYVGQSAIGGFTADENQEQNPNNGNKDYWGKVRNDPNSPFWQSEAGKMLFEDTETFGAFVEMMDGYASDGQGGEMSKANLEILKAQLKAGNDTRSHNLGLERDTHKANLDANAKAGENTTNPFVVKYNGQEVQLPNSLDHYIERADGNKNMQENVGIAQKDSSVAESSQGIASTFRTLERLNEVDDVFDKITLDDVLAVRDQAEQDGDTGVVAELTQMAESLQGIPTDNQYIPTLNDLKDIENLNLAGLIMANILRNKPKDAGFSQLVPSNKALETVIESNVDLVDKGQAFFASLFGDAEADTLRSWSNKSQRLSKTYTANAVKSQTRSGRQLLGSDKNQLPKGLRDDAFFRSVFQEAYAAPDIGAGMPKRSSRKAAQGDVKALSGGGDGVISPGDIM